MTAAERKCQRRPCAAMRGTGFEPAPLSGPGPKPGASASSATLAGKPILSLPRAAAKAQYFDCVVFGASVRLRMEPQSPGAPAGLEGNTGSLLGRAWRLMAPKPARIRPAAEVRFGRSCQATGERVEQGRGGGRPGRALGPREDWTSPPARPLRIYFRRVPAGSAALAEET